MAVTRDSLVQRVRDLLNDQPFTTTSTTTTTSSTVVVPDGSIWSQGDVLEWQTGTVGFEQAYLTADASGNNLTTSRGYGGTTAETHASGALVVQNPSFFGRQIQQALDDGIRTLVPYVWKTEDLTLSVAGDGTDPYWYNVNPGTEQVLGIVKAVQEWGTSPRIMLGYFGRRGTPRILYESIGVPTDVASYGVAVAFPDGKFHATNDITLTVMEPILGTTADIPDDAQFPVADYLIYFAAGRLVQALEIPRVSVGSDLETSGTVGTGSRLQTGAYYANMAKQRLEQLAITYRRLYNPIAPTR